MPESNFAQPADRAAMREMIRDVESQIESMTRSLENMRSVVSRLSAAMDSGESAGQRYNFGFEAAPAKTDDTEPFDFTAAAAALSQELASSEPQEQPVASMAPPVPEPVRDYPGRDSAPAPEPELPPEPEPETEWHGVADGASWPIAPRRIEAQEKTPAQLEDEVVAEPAPVAEPEPGTAFDFGTHDEGSLDVAPLAEPAHAEPETAYSPIEAEIAPPDEPIAEPPAPEDWNVAVAFDWPSAVTETGASEPPVDSSKADEKSLPRSLSSGWPDESMWSQSFEWPAMRNQGQAAEPEEGAAGPNDFRSIVDQVKAEIEAARASGQTIDLDDPLASESAPDEEARRAEVQRMVEEMRDRMSAGGTEDLDMAPGAPESDDEEARREETRRAVEQMRAELAGNSPPTIDGEAPSDEDVRDEVRRTVEAAKAELSGSSPQTPIQPAPPPAMDWSHMQADTSGPPVIVVKDNEGRVELASVYDMLNRLACGESAALLNYTPHSVTIGLPIRAPTPGEGELIAAAKDVFGRECSVDLDGPRITVQIGTDPKKKRSEDAA
jgi:hypothetical protein